MKLKTSELKNSIQFLMNGVTKKATMPILETVFVKGVGDQLQLMTSDLENFFSVEIPVEGKTASFCIDAVKLKEIISVVKSDEVEIDYDGKRVEIKFGKSVHKLPIVPAEDYPEPVAIKEEFSGILEKDVVMNLKNFIVFMSDDEIRRNMNGIYLGKYISATDGFRLMKLDREVFEESIIIPSKLVRILSTLETDLEVKHDKNSIELKFANKTIMGRLVNDTFPNVENVIPKDNNIVLKVERKLLDDKLKECMVSVDEITKRTSFLFTKDKLELRANEPDRGLETVCEMEAESNTDEPFEIAFNARYVRDMVSVLKADFIEIKFSAPSKACIYTDEELTVLVMPVKLN